MLGLATLMVLLFIAAIGALMYIASSENQRFLEHSISDAQKALSAEQELIGRALRDYAFWNDAYLHLGGATIDLDWAYTRDNLGATLFQTYPIKAAFIVASDGLTRYALISGVWRQVAIDQYVTGNLLPLFRAARRLADNDTDRVSHGFYTVDGLPAVVYAAVLKPAVGAADRANEQLSLLVFVDVIDQAHLLRWQDNYALEQLQALMTSQPGPDHSYFSSQGAAGGTLQLRWKGEGPGDVLLRTALPILALVMLSFGAIARYFYRSAVRSALMFDRTRQHIEYLARHDPLTGLANRTYLQQHLEQALSLGLSADAPLYLISLDLDFFKPINDVHGHAIGDAVLCEVATRLIALVGEPDLVARLGGDEFVLVVSGANLDIQMLCTALCRSVARPMALAGKHLGVGVSIGVAAAPTDATSPTDLLRLSDIALYVAKAMGRNNWQLYTPGMDRRAVTASTAE